MYSVQTSGTSKGSTESRPTIPTGPTAGAQLLPVTPALRAQLDRAAAADGHRVIAPTHVVVRDGRVRGYASCGAVPLFFAWMDTEHATARDTITGWRAAEAVLQAAGHKLICLPCEAQSPLMPLVPRFGYETIGTANFNLKVLAQP